MPAHPRRVPVARHQPGAAVRDGWRARWRRLVDRRGVHPATGCPGRPTRIGQHRRSRGHVGAAAVEAASNASQADANDSYSYEVAYQVDDAGNRQAVIMLYQVQSDADGNVRVVQTPGVIDTDGNIVPAPPG